MTVRKIGVTVGDQWSAMRAARYSLDRGEAPATFAKYYTADEAELEGAGPNVIWLGTADTLAKLGVERGAAVLEEDLALALQGLSVDERRVRRPGTRFVPTGEVGEDGKPVLRKEQRVNSADLTFSAPKSVSVVWSQASPELRRRIERAMLVAANAGLEYMMHTKPVIQGRGIAAQGFAASAALQVTARTARGDEVPAPQLHVHGVVVGVDDGARNLFTPDTAALYKEDAPLEGGAVFRARLAEELRELGFELEWGTGRNNRFFEIEGVPKGLIEAMSPRTHEVMRMVAQIEAKTGQPLTGPARAAVGMLSRAAKDKTVAVEEIIKAWDDLAAAYDFGGGSIEALQRRSRRSRPVEELRDQAREAILAQIREQGPIVSAGAARAIAFQVAPMGLTLQDAGELLIELQRSGELIALEREAKVPAREKEGNAREVTEATPEAEAAEQKVTEGDQVTEVTERRIVVTTREIRSLEEGVIATAVAAATRGEPGLSAGAVAAGIAAADQSLGEGKSLDDEQQEAIRTLTAGAGWATLTGRAGTGKGPVLEAVAVAHRADGWQVIAGAVDGATAQRLGHQVKAQALTIDQILARVSRDRVHLDDRTVILIDEASKVGLKHWARIAELVERDGVRVIPIGHAGQMGAIELPGMFEQMLAEAGIPTKELTEIRRHRNPLDPSEVHPWLGDYQTLLDQGKGQKAIEMLRKHDAISMHATREESIQALIDGWDERRQRYEDVRDAILVVHGSNDDVDRVNELAQARRIDNGELGEESVQAVDCHYRIHAGDVVMLRERAYEVGDGERRVENGTIGVVESVDPRTKLVRVRLQEPGAEERTVTFDHDELRRRVQRGEKQVPALRLAYAFHPFPLQGATVKDVAVLAGHKTQDKEGTYTADTRAEWYLHVHVDRESLGRDGTDEQRFLRYGMRVMTSQERMASIALNRSSEELTFELPWGEPVPELWSLTEMRKAAMPEPPAPTITDALAGYRDVLGDLRADRLAIRATRLREQYRDIDMDALRTRLEALGDPLAEIDRAGARETLRIERDKEILNEQIDAAEAEAQQLEARVHEIPAIRRRERSGLANAALTQRELANRDLNRLGLLHDAEAELHRDGRHLKGWWEQRANDAAHRLAIDEELASRHERERDRDDEWDARLEPEYEHEYDFDAGIDAGDAPALDM